MSSSNQLFLQTEKKFLNTQTSQQKTLTTQAQTITYRSRAIPSSQNQSKMGNNSYRIKSKQQISMPQLINDQNYSKKENSEQNINILKNRMKGNIEEDELDVIEHYKYERVLIQNVGQWVEQQKNQRKNNHSRGEVDSLSKQMMKNLSEGIQSGQENQFETNKKYMTPQINMNLINGTTGENTITAEEFFEEEQNDERSNKKYIKNGFRPSDTQEMRRLYQNQKIVNDVLLTKLLKQQESKGSESMREILEKNTQDALSSFKNLIALIPHLPSAINYKEVYKKLIDSKQMPTKIIDPVKDKMKNWEKAQKQFEQIVHSQIQKIEECNEEIQIKKQNIAFLRQKNYDLRQSQKIMNENLDNIQKKYQRKIIQISQANLGREPNFSLQKLRDHKENETINTINQIQKEKQMIADNNEKISIIEDQMIKSKKNKENIRDQLIMFLKMVLKSETIYLNNSLSQVVKHLLNLKVTLQSVDFPLYLDEESKNYLITNAQIEIKIEQLQKGQIEKEVHQKQQIRSPDSIFGLRPQFEAKLQEFRSKMAEYKKENSHAQKGSIIEKKIMKVLTEENTRYALKQSEISQDPHNRSRVNSYIQNQQTMHQLEEKIELLQQQEIQRLKSTYASKGNIQSVQVRIYTLVQAVFGRKRMNEVLLEVFGQQFIHNLNSNFKSHQDEETQKQNAIKQNNLEDHIRQVSENCKQFEAQLQQKNEVQYQFDLLQNYNTNFKHLIKEEPSESIQQLSVATNRALSSQMSQRIKKIVFVDEI